MLHELLQQLPPLDTAQLIGLLSFVIGIYSFAQKDDRKLKISLCIMYVNHAIHFALLGAVTACLGAFLAVVRTGISVKTSSKYVAYVFILVTASWGVYLSNTWHDMLPIVGSCIGTYALFCMHGILMRVAFVVGAFCWLLNNILIGSIGTTLLELTLLAVNISTILRLYRDKKNRDKKTSS